MNHLIQYSDEELEIELSRRKQERYDNFISALDTVTIDAYIAGYETGYTWLTRGWNFVHPTEYRNGIHGYIPGGPLYFNLYDKQCNPKEYQLESVRITHKAKRWHQGYRDGINAYVRDQQLNYPMI